jgi:hypothetical protein
MPAFCRICHDAEQESTSDTYVCCNNCGSFACPKHYVWWGTSKNAFCTTCFPKQAGQAVGGAAAALQAVMANGRADGVEGMAVTLNGIAMELGRISLQDLVQLLQAIVAELERRDRSTAA